MKFGIISAKGRSEKRISQEQLISAERRGLLAEAADSIEQIFLRQSSAKGLRIETYVQR